MGTTPCVSGQADGVRAVSERESPNCESLRASSISGCVPRNRFPWKRPAVALLLCGAALTWPSLGNRLLLRRTPERWTPAYRLRTPEGVATATLTAVSPSQNFHVVLNTELMPAQAEQNQVRKAILELFANRQGASLALHRWSVVGFETLGVVQDRVKLAGLLRKKIWASEVVQPPDVAPRDAFEELLEWIRSQNGEWASLLWVGPLPAIPDAAEG